VVNPFAGHGKQDGDEYDDQYDVFAGGFGHAIISKLFCEVFPE
jgi:hypothetical protein